MSVSAPALHPGSAKITAHFVPDLLTRCATSPAGAVRAHKACFVLVKPLKPLTHMVFGVFFISNVAIHIKGYYLTYKYIYDIL